MSVTTMNDWTIEQTKHGVLLSRVVDAEREINVLVLQGRNRRADFGRMENQIPLRVRHEAARLAGFWYVP